MWNVDTGKESTPGQCDVAWCEAQRSSFYVMHEFVCTRRNSGNVNDIARTLVFVTYGHVWRAESDTAEPKLPFQVSDWKDVKNGVSDKRSTFVVTVDTSCV